MQNIGQKLRQLYAALGRIVEEDLGKIRRTITRQGERVTVKFDFSGGFSEEQLANEVSLLLSNIGCLKDHLKVWCEENEAEFNGEQLINENPNDVAIIHDLWNRDKHGTLDRSRSNRFPSIGKLSRSFGALSGKAGLQFNPATMSLEPWVGKGGLHIDGEIVDSEGKRIGGLLNIATIAADKWETLIVEAGAQVPSPEQLPQVLKRLRSRAESQPGS